MAGAGAEAAVEVASAMGAEGQALAALGFDPADIAPDDALVGAAKSSAGPSAGEQGERERGDRGHKRLQARVLLRKNMLHGEAVVQTRDGTKTIVVQRGTVTAIDGTTITVKSADGYTLTWTFGDRMHVVEHRTSIEAQQIAVGTEVGVAGGRDGDQTIARLIVIPKKK
jgi:hypothetical protein